MTEDKDLPHASSQPNNALPKLTDSDSIRSLTASLNAVDWGAAGVHGAARAFLADLLSSLPDLSARSIGGLDPAQRDFLLAYLNLDLALDEALEPLLSAVRRNFLFAGLADQAEAQDIEVLCAIANFAFGKEYVFDETPEETQALRGLSLYGGPVQVALLAAYRPLYRLHQPRWLLDIDAPSPAFTRLLTRQLREPLEEADLIPTIRSLAPIADAVSLDVQRMYEEHPYPRWSSVRIKNRNMKKLNILVAGCGSGHQAILWAVHYPNANVVGLDLSRVSLAYGLRKARELNISNLEFVHGDILDVSRFARSFDIISCFGVLHHMRSPSEGLRALRGALTDRGYIELGLYSEAGRQPVVHAIRLRRQLGLLPTPEGIRNLRRHILALPPTHPAREITRFFDFCTMSGCRDLLFHVQEHRFDLPGVARLLDETGFKLYDLRVGATATERFHHDVGGGDVASLADWHKFELKNPLTFRNMYPIIIKKA